jgi:CBS domain-containing protein
MSKTSKRKGKHGLKVEDIMTESPACCTPDSELYEAARLMVECDCGEIPVIESRESMKPVGVVTDRDITCRIVGARKNPLELKVRDCMSSPVVTIARDASLEQCCEILEDNQLRRIPVVDAAGNCCGMVSQADLAQAAPPQKTAEVVRSISRPSAATDHGEADVFA